MIFFPPSLCDIIYTTHELQLYLVVSHSSYARRDVTYIVIVVFTLHYIHTMGTRYYAYIIL